MNFLIGRVAILLLVFLPLSLQVEAQDSFSLKEFADLSYLPGGEAGAPTQQLNLILPQGVENPPLLLWIGGGAWAYVDRNKEMPLCRQIAKMGLAVASVGHRLSPALLSEPKRESGIQHPEHIRDIAKAFKWLHDRAGEYGYDPERIYVGGFSSGAHLSTLLAMDSRYLQAHGLSPENIAGIIPVGGGYDIPAYRDVLVAADTSYDKNHIQAVFGPDHDNWVDASPVTYLDQLSVPMLIISEKDTYGYTRVFEERLVETGFEDFEVVHIRKLGHGGLWQNLSAEAESHYRNLIVDFIKRGL